MRKWLAVMLCAMLLLGGANALAEKEIVQFRYLGRTTTRECEVITSNTEFLSEEWYVLKHSVSFHEPLPVLGKEVHVVLCDGATLNAYDGITLRGNEQRLSFHVQSTDPDKMGAVAAKSATMPGIGSVSPHATYHIDFDGGKITAAAEGYFPAIGGTNSVGSIQFGDGAIVEATSEDGFSAITLSDSKNEGTIAFSGNVKLKVNPQGNICASYVVFNDGAALDTDLRQLKIKADQVRFTGTVDLTRAMLSISGVKVDPREGKIIPELKRLIPHITLANNLGDKIGKVYDGTPVVLPADAYTYGGYSPATDPWVENYTTVTWYQVVGVADVALSGPPKDVGHYKVGIAAPGNNIYLSGGEVKAEFTISALAGDAVHDLPKTGDASSLALWLSLLAVSGAGLAIKKRR